MSTRLQLGFSSVKEIITYVLGALTFGYGALEAPTDKAWLVCGGGLAMLGLPLAGNLFDKKGS